MTVNIEDFIRQWDPNDIGSVDRLKAALESVREQRGCHNDWGRFCEDAGQDGMALTEYQLALRDNPDDALALERLCVLYREHGQIDKALSCAERRNALKPADEGVLRDLVALYLENDLAEKAADALARAEEAGLGADAAASLTAMIRAASRTSEQDEEEEKVASSLGVPTDTDVARFAHLFSGRENIYARQWWDESGQGGYTPVRQPLVFQVVKNHLLGSVTIGVYPVRLDNTVTFFAIDIDINKRAIARARGSVKEARRIKEDVSSEARRLQAALSDFGLQALLEDSGYKGRHLWVFLEEPVEASIIRQFGVLFLAAHPLQSPDLHAEFFPKQAEVGSGVGNLIKLPLGIHRRSGRRSRLLLPDGSADPDPYATLRRIRKVPRQTLFAVIIALKGRPASPAPQPEEEAPEAPEMPAVPLPPPPAESWTAADFETHPEVGRLMRSCAVLAALKEKVDKHRRLSHDEQVVLTHSLGHSSSGVLAVNYLFDACVDVSSSSRLQTPLSGNPISCPKIRKRIPHITGQVDCNCSFAFAPDQYPTPRLHLLDPAKQPVPEKPAPAFDPEERTRALGVLRLQRARIEREIVDLEKSLLAYLEKSGRDRIDLEEGSLVLKHEAGSLPALEWEARKEAPEDSKTKGEGN